MFRFNIFFLCMGLYLIACRPTTQSGSSLKIIDGEIVKSPDKAQATYGVRYEFNGRVVGVASGVFVGQNALITNGHVVQGFPGQKVDNIKIVDYQGTVVTQFNPNDTTQVQKIVNQKFFDKNPAVSANNDIGAFVLKQEIPASKLTHGLLPIANIPLGQGSPVVLVGNGINDYRALDPNSEYAKKAQKDNPNSPYDDGVLRRGENSIAEVGPDGSVFMNGFAFKTPEQDGKSVSGPGDSGGSVTITDKQGNPLLAGLLQGGGLFQSTGTENQYFDYQAKPQDISKQPNSAYSAVVDVSKQIPFLQQVNEAGGKIAIPTYYDPTSFKKLSSAELAAKQESLGDVWKGSAVVRASDNSSYTGYGNGGEYRWAASKGYQWYNKEGSPTEYYVQYDSKNNSWVSSGSAPMTSPASLGAQPAK